MLATTVKLSAQCQHIRKVAMLPRLFLHPFRIITEMLESNRVNRLLQAIFVDPNLRFC
jgi:hypothetical protein